MRMKEEDHFQRLNMKQEPRILRLYKDKKRKP